MDALMLLCDSAQVANGKLFILGGAWNVYRLGKVGRVNLGLAIRIRVPWAEANLKHDVRAALVDQDGQAVEHEGKPVEVSGTFEVGRPPGSIAGQPLMIPLAFNVLALPLQPESYRWELLIDKTKVAEESFTVVGKP